jgi:polyisoprenoid-binding protein YceI
VTAALTSSMVWAQEAHPLMHFKIIPSETKITASVAEPMQMIRGSAGATFQVIKGDVQGDSSSIADTGRVSLVIDAASYKSDSEGRDKDVKENALEVQKYPTISFQGSQFPSIQKNGDRAAELQVLGQLTLHGVTKDIVLPLSARIDGQGRFIADGSYTFKFEEYGVKRPSKMMGLMTTGDEATINFHVVADPA